MRRYRQNLIANLDVHVIMSKSQPPQIASRKQPKQVRSAELVAAILEAAAQVLAREGATRFTTARVAERAGVSVGSIYQYFPNKAAILFRLQSDEWQTTTTNLIAILQNKKIAPVLRLRKMVFAFIKSECDEASMRGALHDAAPLYRDAPEAQLVKQNSAAILVNFLSELLPAAKLRQRRFAAELILTTLAAVGRDFSSQARSATEIKRYAEGWSDMFCAYLTDLTAHDAA